jgi:hypothetical protein
VPTGSRCELENKAKDLHWAKDNLDENKIHLKASIYKDARSPSPARPTRACGAPRLK